MREERETAYGFVRGFLIVVVLLLLASVAFRRPNPRVTRVLTYPPPRATQVGN